MGLGGIVLGMLFWEGRGIAQGWLGSGVWLLRMVLLRYFTNK